MLSSVWTTLRAHPVRSVIALLQALVGAAVVTLALALAFAQGRSATFSQDLTLFGAGQIGTSGRLFVWLFMPSDLPRLMKLAPDVQQLEQVGGESYEYAEVGSARYRLAGFQQTGPEYAALTGLRLLHGTYFSAKDAQAQAHVAVISADLALLLFGQEDVVGRRFKLASDAAGRVPEPFRIVGVSEAATTGREGVARPVFTPRTSFPEASKLIVLARPGRLSEAKAQLLVAAQQLYRHNTTLKPLLDDGKPGFYFGSVDDQYGQSGTVNLPLLRSYYTIAALTLIVSSLGVLSALLVSVNERTRDIGMRRAIGATRGQIVTGLLLESSLTTLTGSLIGVGLAWLLAPVLNGTFSTLLGGATLAVTPGLGWSVMGLFLSLNLLFGLVPALSSTRIRPTEALRAL
ncbi:FtsX-like permease family protein [Deinococcus sp.]|uniref:ABC transporter permease n=1 Tax=Deinococcus sp. TaxID=47478 RepID=UPI0025F7B668|nr:FtsX-like permease family protein [Deinococcus sp.]